MIWLALALVTVAALAFCGAIVLRALGRSCDNGDV